jgi:hypothetical protein
VKDPSRVKLRPSRRKSNGLNEESSVNFFEQYPICFCVGDECVVASRAVGASHFQHWRSTRNWRLAHIRPAHVAAFAPLHGSTRAALDRSHSRHGSCLCGTRAKLFLLFHFFFFFFFFAQVDSWFSLRYSFIAPYLNLVRDAYEGYVLFAFFSLLICFLEGDKEGSAGLFCSFAFVVLGC